MSISFRHRTIGAALAALLIGAQGLVAATHAPPVGAATNPCSAPVQVIACENSKPGSPRTDWDVTGGGDTSIQGFATDMSVNVGGTVHFKVKTGAHAYTVDIYRIGYYQGLGARKWGSATVTASLPQNQPACLTNSTTLLVDCGNWAESASWAVPAAAVSGVYMAHLVRSDTGGETQIPFVVRNDASHSALVFQTSDTTWQAYNDWGGASLYTATGGGRAYKVSYNRPFVTRADTPDGRDFSSGPSTPRCASSSRTATTSVTSRASTPTGTARCCSTTRPSCRSATTSTGRATSEPTSRQPATPG